MSYQMIWNLPALQLDAFVVASDQNTLFQCSSWADIKVNWKSQRIGVSRDGTLVAAALVLIRPMPLGKTLLYIPRGPVMDYHNPELVEFMLAGLKTLAKEKHAIDIRFDPAVLSRVYPYKERKEPHDRQNEDVIALLQSLGARHRGYTTAIIESTQPRFNAAMDVTADFEKKLEHKTVKCIRAAVHKGVEVFEGPQYLDDFATAMHYTEVRKKVALRNKEYFANMLRVYGDHCILMVAKLNFPKQISRMQGEIDALQKKLDAQPDQQEAEQLKEKLQKNRSLLKQFKSDGEDHKAEIKALNKENQQLQARQKLQLSAADLQQLQQQMENDRKEVERLKEEYAREGREEVITCGILAVYNDKLMELFYMGNHPDYMRLYSSYLLYCKCLQRCVELGIHHCSFGGVEGTLDDGLTLFKSNWLMNVEEYIGEFNIVTDPFLYSMFDRVYPLFLKHAMKESGKSR